MTDNSIGGVTGGVPATTGAPGDWGQIDLMSKANTLTYCDFTYGTTPLLFNSYYNNEGYAIVDHCSFRHNSAGGIWAERADASTVITNNTFADNNADGTSIWDLIINGNANVTASGNTVADTSYILW